MDNQLRGRAGRQGDLGSTRFFLSLEDNLLRIFGGDRVANLMNAFRVENNYNGYLCDNLKDFKSKIYHLLNNDDDYFRFRNNLMNDRGKNRWSDTTDSLIKLF